MRILQIIDNLHPGGAERMAVQIANGLVDQVELSGLCCTREEGLLKEQLDPNVVYLFAGRTGLVGINGIARINNFIKLEKFTHLHVHSTSLYIGSLLAMLIPSIKMIWHDHYGNAQFLQNRFSWKMRLASVKVDAIISVNDTLKKWALKNGLSRNVTYLQNFAKPTKKTQYVDNLPGNYNCRVVCLANLRPQKNHLFLLEVWKDLHVRFPEWELLLVGKCFSDDYQKKIMGAIKTTELKSSVHILGATEDVQNILTHSTIGVLASSSEGLPLAILEYGLAGLPVLVTDVGACKEVVGNRGIVVPSNDHLALKSALFDLMSNPHLRSSLAASYQKHVLETFDESKYIKKLKEIYSGVNV